MNKAMRVVSWIVGVLVVLFLVGLGIRVAKALIFIGVLVGVAMLLYALLGKREKRGKSP